MYAKAFGSGFSPVQGSSSGSDAGGGWNSVSINGNGTFTLPSLGTYPLPPPGKMEKIPLQDGKFFKIRQRADGAYEGKFGPTPQPPSQPSPKPKAPEHPAVTAALNFVQTAFQPPTPQQPKAPEHKHFAQTAFQPSPQPKPKAPEHKAPEHKPDSSSSFAPKLTAAVKHAQTAAQAAQAFQPAPAPSSGGWSSVAINRNGTFTLPSIGTFPLPAPGKMEKIPLQDGKFFKIRQRADGAYEGKFGPDSQPAPKQSQPTPKQPLPARLEDRKKDAGGWAQIEVDRDGMIRLPNHAQALYRPKPGQTESYQLDARTTFRFRQGADGDVYGTFETKAPSQPPPGWQRINVDPDGMIRLPGHTKSFYPPQPGKTESIQLDDKTTFTLSQAEDGEVYGTIETAPPPAEDQPGLDVDVSKREFEGVVSTRQMEGKKVVDVGALGTLVAPAPGGTDSYLLAQDKLLVLDGNADGTVKVSTRELGIKNTSDGFKGALLPPDGTLVFAGRSFEVSKLKNGEKIKKHGEIDGKRFALEVRKNHDGTVTVTGRRDQGLLNTVLGWAGKLLPILGAIPGLGVVALAAKVVTAFNAVKGFAQSVKNGNVLGMVSSAAGAVAGFSQGAFQAFASKVANIANVGQQVMTTLKHGLGNGLLQVVSNGANLVSGIAQAAADLGQGAFQSEANNLAQATGTVAGYAGGADSALKGDLAPLVTQVAGDVVRNNPPQVKNPVANPPPVPNPFQGTPPKGTEYSVSQPPAPSFVKPPKDTNIPVSQPPSLVKPPKAAERPFAPGPSPVLVAGPPTAGSKPQNMMELLKANWPSLPTLWGSFTDELNNGAHRINAITMSPILLAMGVDTTRLSLGEIFPNFFTTVLGAGADLSLKNMGAQVIGASFLWAKRPQSAEGEVLATPVQLTVEQTRNNFAYVGLVQSTNPARFGSIASMYAAAKRTGVSQTNVFTARNPLLGSMKINVTVAPDGRVAANLEDGWRWSTTFSDGKGGYTGHGGGAARNVASGLGEIMTFGKRIVVPVTSETVTETLKEGEKRSDIDILRSFGPQLSREQEQIRTWMHGG